MTNERLDNIQKGFENSPEYRGKLILELISEIRTLRKLVEAVDGGGFDTEFHDVDGKNWFDLRDKVLNQE